MDGTVEGLKALFDLGGVVVVTAMLWIVWRRLNDVTDQLINILGELRVQMLAIGELATMERQRNLKPPQ